MRRIGQLHTTLLADPRSLTAQTAGGDGYTALEHLMFLAVDELRTANWQRTKDGAKNRNRPRPISPLAKPPGRKTGHTDRSPSDVAALLARYGPARPEPDEGGVPTTTA